MGILTMENLDIEPRVTLLDLIKVYNNSQGREVMFDLISWRIHEFYKSKVSSAVTVRPVKEIKNDPQVNFRAEILGCGNFC